MNHVVGVTSKPVKGKYRSVIALRRNKSIVLSSSPALLAVGK